jgi:hypothetical protein
MKTVIKSDLDFELKLKLPKDTTGLVRRDVMEDKEKQVQGLIFNKIRQCLNFDIAQKRESEEDQIMQDATFRP